MSEVPLYGVKTGTWEVYTRRENWAVMVRKLKSTRFLPTCSSPSSTLSS